MPKGHISMEEFTEQALPDTFLLLNLPFEWLNDHWPASCGCF